MVFKKSFTLLVATGTTLFFVVVPIISENHCRWKIEFGIIFLETLISLNSVARKNFNWRHSLFIYLFSLVVVFFSFFLEKSWKYFRIYNSPCVNIISTYVSYV